MEDKVKKDGNSLAHIFNVYYPEPVTIIELAEIVREAIVKYSQGEIDPEINVVDTGQPSVFNENDKRLIKVDTSKALDFLEMEKLKSPKESVEDIVRLKVSDN